MHTVKIGDSAPDFSLVSLEGVPVHPGDYRGTRTLFFIWATWEYCREHLAGWEAFYKKHRSEKFQFVSVAMDARGPKVVRPYVQAARTSFVTVVDSAEALWHQYGFDLLPSGYYLDEWGHIRFLKVGGFDVTDTTTVKILEDLLADKWPKKPIHLGDKTSLTLRQEMAELSRQLRSSTRGAEKRLRLAELLVQAGYFRKAAREYEIALEQHPKNVKALFGRGVVYLREKKLEQALGCWRKAHALAPSNWIIRKQIWTLEAPGQFYPSINYEWQKEQVRREELLASTEQKAKARAQRR